MEAKSFLINKNHPITIIKLSPSSSSNVNGITETAKTETEREAGENNKETGRKALNGDRNKPIALTLSAVINQLKTAKRTMKARIQVPIVRDSGGEHSGRLNFRNA